jgi:hypothetical protein
MWSTIEQCHTELLLERLDLVTDRGGRDEQCFGRCFEAQLDGSDLKGLEEFE